jgi:hypothetical protein
MDQFVNKCLYYFLFPLLDTDADVKWKSSHFVAAFLDNSQERIFPKYLPVFRVTLLQILFNFLQEKVSVSLMTF